MNRVVSKLIRKGCARQRMKARGKWEPGLYRAMKRAWTRLPWKERSRKRLREDLA